MCAVFFCFPLIFVLECLFSSVFCCVLFFLFSFDFCFGVFV